VKSIEGKMASYPRDTAAAQGLATCHTCLKLAPVSLHECPRCGAALHLRKPESLQRTVALLITSFLFYIPANMLPITRTISFGKPEDGTVLDGVLFMWHHGAYPVAIVIFVASIFVPMAKMLAISWLCWTASQGKQAGRRGRATIYRITEFVGRWSMVDVFVVAILVALIHLGSLLTILPGAAALTFAMMVILTMIAAHAFDPRLIWDEIEETDG
jgi:paraquat-inducible protein A